MKQTEIERYEQPKKENRINFSHNWNNKLDSKFFTTIRNIEKANYYQLRVKEVWNVYLNDVFYCKALLQDANVLSFRDVKTPEIFVLDTGTLNYKELFAKFKVYDDFVLLLFERLDK